MDGSLQQSLQNGKAHPNIKKVWMLKWAFSFVMFFIFLTLMLGIRILFNVFNLDIISIIIVLIVIPIFVGLIFSYLWAHLYWRNYNFEVGQERITITRGVIGKRVANIPYERVQNVNIWRGVLDRIFGLYSIEIETAGASNVRGAGGYGTRMNAEGTIQGLINPQPIVEFIIAKSKGRSGLGDFENKREIGNAEKLRLLEEKLLKGEISEKTYEELKRKYGPS